MTRTVGDRRRVVRAVLGVVTAGAALAACEHTTPFDVPRQDPLGPYDTGPIVRLTFDPSEDRDPSGRDALVVYSHLNLARPDRDWCLGFLPADGGTLLQMACPGDPEPDGRADAWLQAVISPNADRIAFVHYEGRSGSISVGSRSLEVAPVAEPRSAAVVVPSGYTLPDGRYADAFRQVEWAGTDRLRFLAGTEILVRDDNLRILDTVFTPHAMVEIPVSGGAMTIVPGTDGAAFYAPVVDGLWVVRGNQLRFVPTGADSASVSFFIPGAILDLTAVDGVPILAVRITLDALVGPVRVGAEVDTATGAVSWMQFPFDVTAVRAVPNARRLLIEGFLDGGTDIWRYDLP